MKHLWSPQIDKISILAEQLGVNPQDSSVRHRLLCELDVLKRSVQQPVDLIHQYWTEISRLRVVAALLDHNVIQSIPTEGSISAQQLAKLTLLDAQIITRLMRHLTAQGIVGLAVEDTPAYSHTHLSRVWLQSSAVQHTLMMINNVCSPDLGAYLRTHTVGNMEDPSHCPSAWAAGIEGQNFWEVMSRDATKMAAFDEGLQYTQQLVPAFGSYPIESLLALKLPKEAPLMVDVGGGRGQSLIALKNALPKLTGRLICQDRPDVLASIPQASKKVFETMSHDFFTPQPIMGAQIYYLRLIIHDWDDASVCRIFEQLVPAMSSSSRVLIHDALLPRQAIPGIDLSSCWMDYAVMMLGGKERTEAEIVRLLEKAGLQHVKTWTSDTSAYAVIEASLPHHNEGT